MTTVTSTGAVWADISVMGIGALSFPLLLGVALLTHPGTNLDPILSTIALWITLFGGCLVATGMGLGRRTGWKVPDPKRAKTR